MIASGRLQDRIVRFLGAAFGWSIVVEMLQLVSSVLLFLLLARVWEPTILGQLGAVQALSMNTLSVASLGTHLLLLSRTSGGDDVGEAWSRSLTLGVLSTLVAMVGLFVVKTWLAPGIDNEIFYVLVVGNLVFYWVSELAVFLSVGTQQMKRAAGLRAILAVLRIGALAYFVVFTTQSLRAWAWLSTTSFGLGALASIFFVGRIFGVWPSFRQMRLGDAREGAPYGVSGGSESTVDQSDRWMLESFGHSYDAGVYGAGGRIVQFGYLPLRMLMRSFDADLFRAGGEGLSSALVVTKRMAPAGLALAGVASIGLWLGAPIVPMLLGSKWEDAASVIRMLAPLPMIRSVQYLLGNSFTAARLQWWRFGVIVAALVTNVGLNLVYLPGGTWRTAVATTFVSEILMVVLLAALAAWFIVRDKNRQADRDPV